ncbi:MAG: YrdB family protein [Caldilineaceae bacterium]
MQLLKMTNLVVAFLLELWMLAAFGYWGYQVGQQPLTKIGFAIGIPFLVAVIWGIWLAPNSGRRLPEPWLSSANLVIFAIAMAALFSTGRHTLAGVFGVIYLLNRLLLFIWKQ